MGGWLQHLWAHKPGTAGLEQQPWVLSTALMRANYLRYCADGMVHCVRISAGQASYSNRYVQTTRLSYERKAGKAFYIKVRPQGLQVAGACGENGRSSGRLVSHEPAVAPGDRVAAAVDFQSNAAMPPAQCRLLI
jgi:hypothetical protein